MFNVRDTTASALQLKVPCDSSAWTRHIESDPRWGEGVKSWHVRVRRTVAQATSAHTVRKATTRRVRRSGLVPERPDPVDEVLGGVFRGGEHRSPPDLGKGRCHWR
jgi:hypothetical protein